MSGLHPDPMRVGPRPFEPVVSVGPTAVFD
jgi:hypothetical protein